MKNRFRPISISLSPNVEPDDVRLALNLLIRPWLWNKGNPPSPKAPARRGGIAELEEEFAKYIGVKHAVSFNSGRSALYAILKALSEVEGLKAGDNVLLQAFTCNAVPNPVLWAGSNPVYVDCADDFNIDTEKLETQIQKLTEIGSPPKALIVQHTFGLPANMPEIMAIVRQYNLVLVEDCAHALGAEYKNIKVGNFGKAAFFSFSRDKVISSVYGGMAITNDEELSAKLRRLQKDFGMPNPFWTLQQILHPILLNYFILPLYDFFDVGKIVLVLSQILHILSKAVSWQEKRGLKPDYFPRALPNAMAALAYKQLHKIDRFYAHRKQISDYYRQQLQGTKFKLPPENELVKQSYLRFTVRHKDAHDIIYDAWHNQNILLGDWYTTAIAPFDTKMDSVKYHAGSCPNAEYLAKHTLNLPTHINVKQSDAERIINFLKKYA